MVVLLRAYTVVSDAEAVELTVMDARWQLVLGCMNAEEPLISQGAWFRANYCVHTDRFWGGPDTVGQYFTGSGTWSNRVEYNWMHWDDDITAFVSAASDQAWKSLTQVPRSMADHPELEQHPLVRQLCDPERLHAVQAS